MPSDITGTEIIEEDPATGRRRLEFVQGPLFTQFLLADEINRAPPKTQAALLQAMQEREVSVGRRHVALAPPFFVVATQNPIEQEGTYPLPEAQLDRFMLSIHIGYPSRDEERRIVNATTHAAHDEVQPVLKARDLVWIQQLVREVPAGDHMVDYAVDSVRATRPKEPQAPPFIKDWLAWGAGPRAAQYLILAAKALPQPRDCAGEIRGVLADYQGLRAEPAPDLLERRRRRVGFGRVHVHRDGHRLRRLAPQRAEQVDAGLVRIGVLEARGARRRGADAPDVARGADDFHLRRGGRAAPDRYEQGRTGQRLGALGLGAGQVEGQPGQEREEQRLQRQVRPVDVGPGAQEQDRSRADGALGQQGLAVLEPGQHAPARPRVPHQGEVPVDQDRSVQ
ncbi:MAG TPA: AAA family ATPase [Isosphaeraceae bacterium]